MLKRYDHCVVCGDYWHEVIERLSPTGQWVKYDDALALIRAAFDGGWYSRPLQEEREVMREAWIRKNVTGEVQR